MMKHLFTGVLFYSSILFTLSTVYAVDKQQITCSATQPCPEHQRCYRPGTTQSLCIENNMLGASAPPTLGASVQDETVKKILSSILGDFFDGSKGLSAEQKELLFSQFEKLSTKQREQFASFAEKLGEGSGNRNPGDPVTSEEKEKFTKAGFIALQNAFMNHLGLSEKDKEKLSFINSDQMAAILNNLRDALNNDGQQFDPKDLHDKTKLTAKQLNGLVNVFGSLRADCSSNDAKQCQDEFMNGKTQCIWTKFQKRMKKCVKYGKCIFEECQNITQCDSPDALDCTKKFENESCPISNFDSFLHHNKKCIVYGSCLFARCIDISSIGDDNGTTSDNKSYWEKEEQQSNGKSLGVFSTILVVISVLFVMGVIGYLGFRVCVKKNNVSNDNSVMSNGSRSDNRRTFHTGPGDYMPPTNQNEGTYTEL